MITEKPRINPRPNEVLQPLKSFFRHRPLTGPDGKQWELRFIFQPGVLPHTKFDLNIAIVLNSCDYSSVEQHIAYFQLLAESDYLQLRWLLRPSFTYELALRAFQPVYPLQRFAKELQSIITAYPVVVEMPDWVSHPIECARAIA